MHRQNGKCTKTQLCTQQNSLFLVPSRRPVVHKYSVSPQESPRKKQKSVLFGAFLSTSVLHSALLCFKSSLRKSSVYFKSLAYQTTYKKSHLKKKKTPSIPHFDPILLFAHCHLLFFCNFLHFCDGALCTPSCLKIRFSKCQRDYLVN